MRNSISQINSRLLNGTGMALIPDFDAVKGKRFKFPLVSNLISVVGEQFESGKGETLRTIRPYALATAINLSSFFRKKTKAEIAIAIGGGIVSVPCVFPASFAVYYGTAKIMKKVAAKNMEQEAAEVWANPDTTPLSCKPEYVLQPHRGNDALVPE